MRHRTNEWTSVTCNHAILLHHEFEHKHTQAHTHAHFDTSLNSIHVNHFRYPFRLDRLFLFTRLSRAFVRTHALSFFVFLFSFVFALAPPPCLIAQNTLRNPLSFVGVVFVLFHRFSFCILCIKLLLVYFGHCCCCCCYCCFVFCGCFFCSKHINQPVYHVELAHFNKREREREKNQINYSFILIRTTSICNKQAKNIHEMKTREKNQT